RHLDAKSRYPEQPPTDASGEPDVHDHGARPALHRRRPPHPLRLAGAEEAAAAAEARCGRGRPGMSALAATTEAVRRFTGPRRVAIAGIGLGLLGAWLTLPPVN